MSKNADTERLLDSAAGHDDDPGGDRREVAQVHDDGGLDNGVRLRDGQESFADDKAPAGPPSRDSTARRRLGALALPVCVLLVACGVGYVKWLDIRSSETLSARAESVQAATEGAIALLSYRPDTAEQELHAARDRMTGTFLTSYSQLINDVVIPGAKEKNISAVATVPAAASVSASADHAVVLVFVNQSTIVADGPPTNSISSIQVTLDKVDNRWLIADFTPL